MPYELLLFSKLLTTDVGRRVLVVSDPSAMIRANILLPDERKVSLKLVDMMVPKRSQPRVRRVGGALIHDDGEHALRERGRRLTKMGQVRKTILRRILGKR